MVQLWVSKAYGTVVITIKKKSMVSSPLILTAGFAVAISHITNSSVVKTWNTEQNQSNSHTLLCKTDLWKM